MGKIVGLGIFAHTGALLRGGVVQGQQPLSQGVHVAGGAGGTASGSPDGFKPRTVHAGNDRLAGGHVAGHLGGHRQPQVGGVGQGDNQRIGQGGESGRENVKEYLKNNPDFAAEIERQIRENADKLLPGAARRSKEKAKAVEEAAAATEKAPAAEPAKPRARANIDIAVEE